LKRKLKKFEEKHFTPKRFSMPICCKTKSSDETQSEINIETERLTVIEAQINNEDELEDISVNNDSDYKFEALFEF
jgi:hypothetical protein